MSETTGWRKTKASLRTYFKFIDDRLFEIEELQRGGWCVAERDVIVTKYDSLKAAKLAAHAIAEGRDHE